MRFDLNGTRGAEVPVPPMHGASIRGDGPGHAVLTFESFAAPETSWRVDLATGARTPERGAEIPWDGTGVEVRYGAATSKDGTPVPVWVVHRQGVARDGATPTLLFGYGGFYAAQKPSFSPLAAAWVEAGGVYAMAVLRGGSEFGETWHRAGMLTNKPRVFEDFIAAGEWLVGRELRQPGHARHHGHEQRRPARGRARSRSVRISSAPCCAAFPTSTSCASTSSRRSNNMPALLEYGDAAIRPSSTSSSTYSPYQAVRAGTPYPAVLLASGDLDTRVPPLAARKFTARLQAATTSGRPVLLRYHEKGGHAANYGMPFSLRVQQMATDLAFVMRELGLPRSDNAAGANGR